MTNSALSGPSLWARALFCAVAVVALTVAQPAWSQARDGARTAALTLNIPSQPLDSALAAFSQASGMQMLYDSNLTSGRRSTGVSGRFSAQDALVRLLQGTGLRARFTAGGSIVITPAMPADMTLGMLHVEAAPIIGGRSPDAQSLAYVARVQRDIEAVIRDNSALARDDYRISLRLWIGSDGVIARSEVIASSGQVDRDARFNAALRNVRISQTPPDTLPQPLRIEFRVR